MKTVNELNLRLKVRVSSKSLLQRLSSKGKLWPLALFAGFCKMKICDLVLKIVHKRKERNETENTY